MGALPPKAKALIDSLPGKKVSLEMLLTRSIQYSDSFKEIKASAATIDIPELTSQSSLDPTLTATLDKVDDQRKPPNGFQPTRTQTLDGSVGLSKYFSTGTALTAEIRHGRTELNFSNPIVPNSDLVETQGTLSLSQNLWKDSFGSATRQNLEAGLLAKNANLATYESTVEQWVLNFNQVFYNAWLAQAQVKAAQQSVARRERLLRITRTKARRGTAERPDVFQVESLLLNNRIQLEEAKLTLGDIWRQLVLSLKFNESWFHVDPLDVPIGLDNPVGPMLKVCGPQNRINTAPKENATLRAAVLNARAAQLQAKAAINQVNPSLQFSGSLFTNGLDSDGGVAARDAFSAKNPGWAVGLRFEMPLSQNAERANAQEKVATQMRLEAQASIQRDNLKTKWIRACLDLHRAHEANRLSYRAFNNQKERARLEERRFRIGRVPTITVVQSEDDATQAEIHFNQSEIAVRMAAWEVRRVSGRIKSYLEALPDKLRTPKKR